MVPAPELEEPEQVVPEPGLVGLVRVLEVVLLVRNILGDF